MMRLWRMCGAWVCLAAIAVSGGCGPAASSGANGASRRAAAPLPPPDEMRQMLDEVIDFTARRYLDTQRHAAWQIMHAAVAYGRDTMIYHEGQLVPALDWVLAGGNMRGWNMEPTEHGVRSRVESGTAIGPGHEDQWLAILANWGYDWNDTFRLHDRPEQEYHVSDLVREAMWSMRDGKEASWSIVAFTKYLPRDANDPSRRSGKLADARWKAQDGTEWTVERVIAMEAAQDLGTSACGGTHRLTGMYQALKRHKEEGGELTGGWLAADRVIRDSVEKARQYQQPDGSFSTNFFQRPGTSPDSTAILHSTGHTLEFLAIVLPDEELQQTWVARAAVRLCRILQQTRNMDLECGALYHAVNGLIRYRQRLFGPRSLRSELPSADPPAKSAADRGGPIDTGRRG